MPTTLAPKNAAANQILTPAQIAAMSKNIALPDDENISVGNFSVRINNDDIHSDVYVMQMLLNIFGADAKRSAKVALKIHSGSAIVFTGSRDNCRELMRMIALHGGDAAANAILGIENRNGLATEMIRNADGSIVQRSENANDDDGGETTPAEKEFARKRLKVWEEKIGEMILG